jgi:hypothetical protein
MNVGRRVVDPLDAVGVAIVRLDISLNIVGIQCVETDNVDFFWDYGPCFIALVDCGIFNDLAELFWLVRLLKTVHQRRGSSALGAGSSYEDVVGGRGQSVLFHERLLDGIVHFNVEIHNGQS